MNMMICAVLPAVGISRLVDRRHHVAGLARTHLDDLGAQLGQADRLLHVHGARVTCRSWPGSIVCAGPPCDGNSNLMMPVIAAAASDDHPAQAQPETVIIAAPAAAAGAPFGRCLPAGRCLPGVRAVELGLPVPEQARVLLVLVVPPEVLERLEVVGLRLGRPGGRDLRAVEAVARPHRGGSRTTGARGGQDLGRRGGRTRTSRGNSGGNSVAQDVHPGTGGRGEHSDRGDRTRGAEEA